VRASTVIAEVRTIAGFHALEKAPAEELLRHVTPHLERYAELVLCVDGLEVVTGGDGPGIAASLASIAASQGASEHTTAEFERGARAFPGSVLGLKVGLGPKARRPTLYVRAKTGLARGLDFLRGDPDRARALPELEAAFRRDGTSTLYGLGFLDTELGPLVKTYTIADVPADPVLGQGPTLPGFVSYRLGRVRLSREVKRYLPELDWSELRRHLPSLRWRAIADFAERELGWTRAGHLGVVREDDGHAELKVYVERIGAIPTDFSAR
jgi:hypothetical protein